MQYAIGATVTVRHGDWTSVRQVPTFFIDSSVQGSQTVEDAARVAMSVLTTMIPTVNSGVEQIVVTAVRPDDLSHATLTKELTVAGGS